jgi:hypothetical protein
MTSAPEPWAPGHVGRFVIDTKAVLHHWRVDDAGLPSPADVGPQLHIELLMAGEIEGSGECWATERDASCGPMVLKAAFASVEAEGLSYRGRREPQMTEPVADEPRWGRSPDRIPMILAALEREWLKAPDLRLGQLVVNLLRDNTNTPGQVEDGVLFGVSDGALLGWLGPESDEERLYPQEEPRKARRGWREWEKARRESGADARLRQRLAGRRTEGTDDEK